MKPGDNVTVNFDGQPSHDSVSMVDESVYALSEGRLTCSRCSVARKALMEPLAELIPQIT